MPITLELTRPKLVPTNAQNAVLSVGTVVEVDTATEESFFIPITLSSTDPPIFTVAGCTTTSGSAVVTTVDNRFLPVRVGDAVSGTGIPAAATVVSKANNNTITLSGNATASGSATLTFDPPPVVPTVYALRITHSKSGTAFGMKFSLFLYDGTLGGAAGTAANATRAINLLPGDGQLIQVNIDGFLSNLRVPQSV